MFSTFPTSVVVHGTGSCGGAMETYVAPYRAKFPAGDAHWRFPTFQIPHHFLWIVAISDADLQPRRASAHRFHGAVGSAHPYFE